MTVLDMPISPQQAECLLTTSSLMADRLLILLLTDLQGEMMYSNSNCSSDRTLPIDVMLGLEELPLTDTQSLHSLTSSDASPLLLSPGAHQVTLQTLTLAMPSLFSSIE
jgi:hypothetical protein